MTDAHSADPEDTQALLRQLADERERLQERTSELTAANTRLQQEIADRETAELALKYRLEIETLVASISSRFASAATVEIDGEVDRALRALGEFEGVDRAFVSEAFPDGNAVRMTHEWCAEGIQRLKGNIIQATSGPWFAARLRDFENIYTPRVAMLPPEARAEKAALQMMGIQSLLAVPFPYGHAVMGYLGLHSLRTERVWKEEDITLLRMVGEVFVHALMRKRTEEELRATEEQRRQAIIQEREHLARELHDGVAQVLGFVNAKAQTVEGYLARGDVSAAHDQMAELSQIARDVYVDVREAILSLRAAGGEYQGLVAILRKYAEQAGQIASLEIAVEATPAAEHMAVAPTAEVQLVRIVQEALTNVRKHAHASRASVNVTCEKGQAVIAVRDDGTGFYLDQLGRDRGLRFGLHTMRERAESIGAHLEIITAPGEGTSVVVRAPLQPGDPDPNALAGGEEG